MSYDPSQDRPPSPIEMGELFVAAKTLAVAYGTGELGSPNQKPTDPEAMDRPDYSQARLFGIPGVVVDGKVTEFKKYPISSYPPTRRLVLPEVSILRAMVPEAAAVLGLERSLTVLYHEPFILWDGNMDDPPDMDTPPQSADCAFFLETTSVPGVDRRTYKLLPSDIRPDYARGTRTDMYKGTPKYDTNGLLPEIGFREWECLMGIARCATLLSLNPNRTPQEE